MGNSVIQGTGRKYHIIRPGSKGALAKAINVMDIAHPIGTAQTVSAFPTRNDLFADCVVPDFKPVHFRGTVAQSYHFTDELVTRGHRRLAVPDPIFVSPKKGGARVALDVAGAHAGAPDLDQHFTRAGFRDYAFLESVIARAMRHHRRHRFG